MMVMIGFIVVATFVLVIAIAAANSQKYERRTKFSGELVERADGTSYVAGLDAELDVKESGRRPGHVPAQPRVVLSGSSSKQLRR